MYKLKAMDQNVAKASIQQFENDKSHSNAVRDRVPAIKLKAYFRDRYLTEMDENNDEQAENVGEPVKDVPESQAAQMVNDEFQTVNGASQMVNGGFQMVNGGLEMVNGGSEMMVSSLFGTYLQNQVPLDNLKLGTVPNTPSVAIHRKKPTAFTIENIMGISNKPENVIDLTSPNESFEKENYEENQQKSPGAVSFSVNEIMKSSPPTARKPVFQYSPQELASEAEYGMMVNFRQRSDDTGSFEENNSKIRKIDLPSTLQMIPSSVHGLFFYLFFSNGIFHNGSENDF